VKGVEDGLNVHQKLDLSVNLQYAIPFGVRDMLEQKSGAILGTHVGDAQTPTKSRARSLAFTPFSLP